MLSDQERRKLAEKIEKTLPGVKNEASFIRELLQDTLSWPIPEGQGLTVEDLGYEHAPQGRQTPSIERKVLDIFEINLTGSGSQHWGIFILRFKDPHVFDADRGLTGALRELLRDLLPKKLDKTGDRRSWNRDNLLFICTHDYTQFRFGYFKKPDKDKGQPRLAAFGWHAGSTAVRTVCEFNLSYLGWPDDPTQKDEWVAQWASAFNVERVTKQFYEDYAKVFEQLRAAVKGITGEEQKMFTQNLLNRLMFLRFIERKGWLQPPAPGSGEPKEYLRELFARGGYRGKSFYSGRLRKLFFEGLAVEGKQESEAIGKVEFLNGGLFEESKLDEKVADIDDRAFAPLLGPEGLFYRYNFTVQESTPLNVEIAVDPEMLGKVFEELVTGRHESGSYYTPRPIVSYMCREALKGHLGSATKVGADEIAAFVDRHETPFGINDAKSIAKALDELRAVDPACGSGAYLLGLLHEMVDLYQLLYSDKLKTDDRELHRIKLDIIEKCLYGVDKDEFATNIAMLRLWLSLTVDSDTPRALPNLDFKIETGDSLAGPDPQKYSVLHLHERALRLAVLKGKYLRAHGEEKQALRTVIQKEQREIAFELRSLCPGSIDWRVQFCEVFFSERGGFDIVLANPPYIRQELIKDQKPTLKKVYGDLFSGTADLYVFFYLRALQLLAKGGMLVFISSNKWFRAGYGEKLRATVAKTTTVRTILDFHDLPVFESAIAYPMIFVAAKGVPLEDHAATLAEPPTLDPPYPDIAAVVAKHGYRMPATALGRDGSWHLATSSAAELLARMRKAGPALGEYVGRKIFMGLKTGLNEAWIDNRGKVYVKGQDRPHNAIKQGVFFIDGERRRELIAEDAKSAEIIKPLVQGKDIERWRIDRRDQWLIVTRIGIDIKRYPAVLKHLRKFQSALQGRVDQGDNWWELRPCAYYGEFDRPKIVYQEIATYQQFALDTEGSIFNNKVFMIASSDLFLLAVLNSKPAWSFLHEVSAKLVGGAFALQVPFISQLPIPDTSDLERVTIGRLAQKCLDAKGIECEAWEKEIDERVAALYGIDLKDIERPKA